MKSRVKNTKNLLRNKLTILFYVVFFMLLFVFKFLNETSSRLRL